MSSFDHRKYRPFQPVAKADRRWPEQSITAAPLWCSVDLRDGNQALINPMTPVQKMKMFELLVDIGVKQIEVGFPAASQTDFDFIRQLIEENRIPDDVCVQVLTQARKELIERSFEALRGAKQAIMHLYNSTSPVQRERVFKLDKEAIKAIAVKGAEIVLAESKKQPDTQWQFQYSPESFTSTEVDYAVEVCDAVNAVWQPTPDNPVIINLPATVEVSTPNRFADQVEWFCDHVQNRESIVVSLHTHNDRGCAVAAAELGTLAGADRIEGTLLGNGERTGNMDLVTMAMNLYSQGVDPELDLSNMDRIINVVESCTQIKTHPRQPYAGELVFSAFSGSHQDAIRKCLAIQQEGEIWDVAYLPINPKDLGRSYQEVIRINSQSGKGGVTWVLESEQGLQPPRWLQIDFSQIVQREAEQQEEEVSPERIWELFLQSYMPTKLTAASASAPVLSLQRYQISRDQDRDRVSADILSGERTLSINGAGRGAMDAFTRALAEELDIELSIVEYNEHTLGHSSQSEAAAYVQLSVDNQRICGAATNEDVIAASLQAILNAVSTR